MKHDSNWPEKYKPLYELGASFAPNQHGDIAIAVPLVGVSRTMNFELELSEPEHFLAEIVLQAYTAGARKGAADKLREIQKTLGIKSEFIS